MRLVLKKSAKNLADRNLPPVVNGLTGLGPYGFVAVVILLIGVLIAMLEPVGVVILLGVLAALGVDWEETKKTWPAKK